MKFVVTYHLYKGNRVSRRIYLYEDDIKKAQKVAQKLKRKEERAFRVNNATTRPILLLDAPKNPVDTLKVVYRKSRDTWLGDTIEAYFPQAGANYPNIMMVDELSGHQEVPMEHYHKSKAATLDEYAALHNRLVQTYADESDGYGAIALRIAFNILPKDLKKGWKCYDQVCQAE